MHLFIKILILMALWELGYSNEGEALSNLYKDESFEFVNNSSQDVDLEFFNPDQSDGWLISPEFEFTANSFISNGANSVLNTDNGLVYITSLSGIRVYQGTTFLRTIGAGNIYTGILYHPDNNRIYAGKTVDGGTTIDVFDGTTEALVTSFALPGAASGGVDAMVYDSVNSQIYINANTFAQIYVYNNSNTLVTTINTGTTPNGLTLDTIRGILYAKGNSGTDDIVVINGATNSIISRLGAPVTTSHGAYNPDRDLIFLTTKTPTERLTIIDASTQTITGTITPPVAVTRSGALLYNSDNKRLLYPIEPTIAGGVNVLVYDENDSLTQTLVLSTDIGNLGGIGAKNTYDPTTKLMYIAGRLSVFQEACAVLENSLTVRGGNLQLFTNTLRAEPVIIRDIKIDASNQQQLQQVFTRKYRSNFGALKEHDIATSAYRSAQNSLPIANLFNLPGEMIVDQNNWFKTTLKANQSFNFTFWYDDWQAEKILRRFEFNMERFF